MRTREAYREDEPPLLQKRRVKLSEALPLTVKVLIGQGAIDDVTLAFSYDKGFWCELYGRGTHPDQEDLILDWLESYIQKKPMSLERFRLNFNPIPPFTAKALHTVGQIPFGETQTYSDIAIKLGNPKGMRAIGCACHHNPFPLIIPCHRVVTKNGLGGFAYPIKMKQLLLDFETNG